MNEFPKHWESTVKAVMAECNNDYDLSRTKLQKVRATSWISSIFSFVHRKPLNIPEQSHLELSCQIQASLQSQLCMQDESMAKEINHEEYEAAFQLIGCNCCFSEFPFEELESCSEGHLFCSNCVNQFVNEAVFGQGSLRGQSIKCVSVEGCLGTWREKSLSRFVPLKNLQLYFGMLAEKELLKAGIALTKCPFCPYAGNFEL